MRDNATVRHDRAPNETTISAANVRVQLTQLNAMAACRLIGERAGPRVATVPAEMPKSFHGDDRAAVETNVSAANMCVQSSSARELVERPPQTYRSLGGSPISMRT